MSFYIPLTKNLTSSTVCLRQRDFVLEVKVQPINWTSWLDQVYGKGNFDMTVIGHTGRISPYQRLNKFIDTGGYVGWTNESFNALMQKIKNSTDETEQVQLYKEIFTLITNDYPFVFVVEGKATIAMDSRIVDLVFDPTIVLLQQDHFFTCLLRTSSSSLRKFLMLKMASRISELSCATTIFVEYGKDHEYRDPLLSSRLISLAKNVIIFYIFFQ